MAPTSSDRRAVSSYLNEHRTANLERLARLVRIPSVSSPAFNPDPVHESATAVASMIEAIGLDDVHLMEGDGWLPSVYARWDRAPGRPTVLLYAHHDVQPPGFTEHWTSPPFEPEARGGRLYGRGTSDDKAGVVVHLAAVEAWLASVGHLPVNVRLFIDGEEECGNPHLPILLEREADRLRSDLVVVADSANWRRGHPSITWMTRGVASLTFELQALARPIHSGIWGGIIPDPLMGLSRLLASLVDDQGEIAVNGFFDDLDDSKVSAVAPPTVDGKELASQAGLAEGVMLSGDPSVSIADRLWARPCITVLAIDAPAVNGSSNTIQARARARVSVRLGAGQDPDLAVAKLKQHIAARVPWGLNLTFQEGSRHSAWQQNPKGEIFSAAARSLEAAYSHPVAYIGLGGTLPLLSQLRRFIGDVPCLLIGVEDPESRAHGEDESIAIDDLHKACLAEAFFFEELLNDKVDPT